MKIKYIKGDLLASSERIIVHGCNAQGVMGSGIAAAIRSQFPEAYQTYRQTFEQSGLRLGQIVWVETGGKLIANAITQNLFGRNESTRYVSYDAIADVVQSLDSYAPLAIEEEPSVGFPLIGAGLGNGKWPVIAQIIESYSTTFEPRVYLLDGRIPE